MIADKNEQFDRDTCVALTKLGFTVNDRHYEVADARCFVSISHPADEDFLIEVIMFEGWRLFHRRVTREQILSAARAIDPEDEAA